MLRLCSYFVYKINSWKEFITPNMSTIGAFLTLSKNLYPTPNCQKCSKFAQIQCDEFILWVDFTQQIWEKSEHFWQCPKFHILHPKFWELSKMLRLCSYFVYKINSWKEFITPNMSTIGAFLTLSKNLYPTPNCQKCSKFAQIQRDEFILWVDFTQQIWEKSEHFWQCPKFHILYPQFWELSKMLWLCSYFVYKINSC